MALVKCSECGTEISSKASKCPQCGIARRSLGYYFFLVIKVFLAIIMLYIIASIATCAWLLGGSTMEANHVGAAARNLGAASACSVSDIQIKQFTPMVKDNCRLSSCAQIVLAGELHNSCASPAAVKVRITARDARNQVVASSFGWPASTSAIPAGADYPFDMTGLIDYNEKMKTFQLAIEDVTSR